MATAKKFEGKVMSENCDVTVIQFGAIKKPDSGAWSIKILFSLIVAFFLTKTEKRTQNL